MNGDNITASYVTSAAVDSGVGGYAIVASLNDPNSSLSNYTAVISNGVLSVTPAGLTITANPAARAYGSANPVFAAGYNGFVNGEDSGVLSVAPVLATVADTNSPVGSYAITVGGAAAANYLISYVPGVLSVGPAELRVGAQDASRAYGATNPVFVPVYSGFVNGEDAGVLAGSPLLSTVADTNSPVGSYAIDAAQGTLSNANYSFSYTNGTLTVTAYALTLTADNQTKIYGAANPALTGVLTGVVNGDNITASYTTAADAASGVGSYAIVASLNDPDSKLTNYTTAITNGTLTVSPASSSMVMITSTNPALPGTTVTFTATLTAVAPGGGTPTGAVQFKIDGSPVGAPVTLTNGVATMHTATLTHGSHSVTAQYAGNANFTGTTGSLGAQQVINTPPSTLVTVLLTAEEHADHVLNGASVGARR